MKICEDHQQCSDICQTGMAIKGPFKESPFIETLCDTCAKADATCPIYPQETLTCVEYVPPQHPLSALWPALRAEYDRSLMLHPPEEWAGMDVGQMIHAIKDELREIDNAFYIGDIHGVHGVITETLQTAVTALRTYSELKRRANDPPVNIDQD